MAKLGVLTLTGESARKYEFNVYGFDAEFNAIGAVYVVTKRTKTRSGHYSHTKIYAGESGDISTRFDGHHKEECFQTHGANCKCIHSEADEDRRRTIESDLIGAYDPPCND